MDTFTLSIPMLCIICFFVFLADFADAAAGRRRAPLLVPGMALKRGAAFIRPMIFCVMILLLIKIVSDIIL